MTFLALDRKRILKQEVSTLVLIFPLVRQKEFSV